MKKGIIFKDYIVDTFNWGYNQLIIVDRRDKSNKIHTKIFKKRHILRVNIL